MCFTPLKLRFLTLFSLIKQRLARKEKTVVFFSCIEEVKFFYKVFVDAHALDLVKDEDDLDRILALHGDMPQERRKKVYTKFKEASDCVLLSTDVTERGLHFKEVSWIIQYNPAPTIRGYSTFKSVSQKLITWENKCWFEFEFNHMLYPCV